MDPSKKSSVDGSNGASSALWIGVESVRPWVGWGDRAGWTVPSSVVDLDWRSLPPVESQSHVALAPLASSLSMLELRKSFHRASRLLTPGGRFEFCTRSPDAQHQIADDLWPGQPIEFDDDTEYYRPLRHYLELARLYPLRIGVPERVAPSVVAFRCERILENSRHHRSGGSAEAKYGEDSLYRRFDRLEEPEILDDLLHGISRMTNLHDAERVIALGCNDGRELGLIDEVLEEPKLERWGIDLSASAIAAARDRFPDDAHRFLRADLRDFAALELPMFDAVLMLGLLQCTTVDRDRLLEELKPHLAPRCSLLISIPNCHFGFEDILRRPMQRDDPRHDRALVWKDVRYLSRWCYRSGFQHVETYGTYDAFLLARREE